MIILMLFFVDQNMILVKLLQQDTADRSLSWQQEMIITRSCSSHITHQNTSTMHIGALSMYKLS